MGILTVTREMKANADAVWQVFDDFGGVAAWNSNVAKARILNDIPRGVGAERQCDFDPKGKQWVRERITERGADDIHITIFDTNAPLQRFEVDMHVEPRGTGCFVTFKVDLKAKFGPVGTVLEYAAIRPNFRKAIARMLEDLDANALALLAQS